VSDVLSQDEIDALLDNSADDATDLKLTEAELEKLSDVAKMSFGATSSVIQMLINKDAEIEYEGIKTQSIEQLQGAHPDEIVFAKLGYKEGLEGDSYLLLDKKASLIISDLMTGGAGDATELNEMQISALGEMVNQMMGRTTTSLSEVYKRKIDISTPEIFIGTIGSDTEEIKSFAEKAPYLSIRFKLTVADQGEHHLNQLFPLGFAKHMANELIDSSKEKQKAAPPPAPNSAFGLPDDGLGMPQQAPAPAMSPQQHLPHQHGGIPPMSAQNNQNHPGAMPPQGMPGMPGMPGIPGIPGIPGMPGMPAAPMPQISPAEFGMLQLPGGLGLQSNIDLLLDVPLQITVELGRTKMLIKDVLELGIGSVVELNKLAGESVEIFVNQKLIAKGEVVVIDENFAVRITSIINPQDRLKAM
jgi:flagellar motor switch protein FliN/FliY